MLLMADTRGVEEIHFFSQLVLSQRAIGRCLANKEPVWRELAQQAKQSG